MSTYWNAQEELLLRTLLPTNTYAEIAEQFSRRYHQKLPGFKVERSADAVRRKCDREGWTAENVNDKPATTVDSYWSKLEEIVSKHQEETQVRRRGLVKRDQIARKILVLSDIHFPLARTDFIEEILDQHGDADVIVLNGDLTEGDIVSSWGPDKRIALIDEYNAVLNFVAVLVKRFPNAKIILVDGNHDVRASKYLATRGVDPGTFEVLRPNLMGRIANGEVLDRTGLVVEKLDFGGRVLYDPRESWFVKVGKAIIFHPSTKGGGEPGATVTSIGPKLGRRYTDDEVDTYVCGHTHKVYKGVINGKLFVEQGCLAGLMSYFFKPTNGSTKHYQNGYCVLFQDAEGNTDFNLSGPVYLGECIPPKKDVVV